ncbi:MAG TPA: hypothetical protein VG711_10635 [Phycisphaerales bacterium]|nr:hypothetical protein [Phycisphaerales bacterium]
MQFEHVKVKFARMGARVLVEPARELWQANWAHRIDVVKDRHGEFYHLMVDTRRLITMDVLDVQPRDRHLLLMVRQRNFGQLSEAPKQKFLCGHDERAWFVAAIPESATSVSTVRTAMEALKPTAVLEAQSQAAVRMRDRQLRKNEAFVRQGEWFFVPRPGLKVDAAHIRANEPLARGRGKAHWAEFAVRIGGETVYVSHVRPNGLTASEYREWIDANPKLRGTVRWSTMRRNPQVFVRGRVRHPDHKTIVLNGWHEVVMNTETLAAAMRNVAFLD